MGHLRPILLLALGALGGTGCLSDSPDDFGFGAKDLPNPGGWMESGDFVCRDFGVLWEVSKTQAVLNGFRLDDDATSDRRRQIVTRWKLDLATAKYSGFRRRRFLEFLPRKEPKDAWKVRVATVVQRNADMDDPLNPAKAEWRNAAPDLEDAERIAYIIETQFREPGPSKEFEIR